MNEARIEQLKNYLKEDPNDPFLIYALAIEYQHEKPETALTYFEQLLAEHENYTGTYYHAANLYLELNRLDEAEVVFKKGTEICRNQNDAHALRELQTAYNNYLLDEI